MTRSVESEMNMQTNVNITLHVNGLKQGASHCRCQLWNAEEPAAPPFALSYNPLLLSRFVSTASSAYTGVIIGVFVAVLIVGSAAVLSKALYSSRHQICLGNFGLTL